MMPEGWTLTWTPDRTIFALIPEHDVIDHIFGMQCPCIPSKLVMREGMDVIGVQFVHTALDGRSDR